MQVRTAAGYRKIRVLRKYLFTPWPPGHGPGVLLAVSLALGVAAGTGAQEPSSELEPAAGTALAREFEAWLSEVQFLIHEEERTFFLSLDEDFRRHAFIEAFWAARDPNTDTPYNEFKRRWDRRRDRVDAELGGFADARAKALLLLGPPGRFQLRDGRVLEICYDAREELEIWFYGGSERTQEWFALIFYRPIGRRDEPHVLWTGEGRLDPGSRRRLPTTEARLLCAEETKGIALANIRGIPMYPVWIAELMAPPPPNSEEWVANFAASSTLLPGNADLLDIDLDLEVTYPGRNQNRTAVAGVLRVPASALENSIDGVQPTYHFLLSGEVVRDGRLFEQFHYRFDAPPEPDGAIIPLVFQRYLRPGDVELHLKFEDLLGHRFAKLIRPLTIPTADQLASVRPARKSELFDILTEAREASERGQSTVRLVPPPEGSVHIGLMRFSAVVTGDVRKVAFFLDGRQIMAKTRPPYSIELDLGTAAAFHQLRVEGYDAAGATIARDERRVNRGGQRFRVRLVEPVRDRHYRDSLAAIAQVEVPDGEELDRVELFLGERRVATLYQEPFEQAILLADDALTYVRAVGFLVDGNTAEDTVFINAPEYFEQLDVRFVEIYAGVFRNGRPILDLDEQAFTVYEDGELQQIRRFDAVSDLPIHTALLIDTSASMGDKLDSVTAAARTFVDQTLQPRDRATLLSFSNRVEVPVRFTNQASRLAGGLASLRASGGTALYDSLIFALHYFEGIKGPKALLLLSDGEDEASRFGIEHVMATARRAGVMIYVIGLKDVAEKWETRRVIDQVANETGGRAFFLADLAELPSVYRTIENELRSQYLLVYQSSSSKGKDEFRTVRVAVERRGAEVRTLSGYYP